MWVRRVLSGRAQILVIDREWPALFQEHVAGKEWVDTVSTFTTIYLHEFVISIMMFMNHEMRCCRTLRRGRWELRWGLKTKPA